MQVKDGVVVAITGASGAAYGLRLLKRLGDGGVHTHVLVSEAARVVLHQEAGIELPAAPAQQAQALIAHLKLVPEMIRCYALDDWFAPMASGSSRLRRMVVIPCSMGTLARISLATSDNLIERAADVMLKEKGRLIVVPRETPLSVTHLEHMLKLARQGVHIIPAMPGFYHRPKGIEEIVDFIVDRVLDHLQAGDDGVRRWGQS